MLDKYRAKRNFEVTPEPSSSEEAIAGSAVVPPANIVTAAALNFVIQKHSARRLHYDLRLEADGALKSWAVPKGPSLRTTDRHLAVHVEDHPLSYASFEGVIPKGEYGGGEVIVWDRGVYAAMTEKKEVVWDRDQAEQLILSGLKNGRVKFWLEGEKVRGGFMLVKTKRGEDWLLIKEHDEGVADRDVTADDGSVITGKTNEDLRKRPVEKKIDLPATAIKGPIPYGLIPMKLTEAPKAFSNPDWAFELKLDGVRALITVEDGRVKMISRNSHDITAKFPTLAQELAAIAPKNCVLDGEIVAYDDEGKPSFQRLMQRYNVIGDAEIRAWDRRLPVDLVLFDILYLDDSDLRKCTFRDRRRVLEELEIKGRHTKTVDLFPEIGEILYEQARNLGLEGIVGKRLDSTYASGERTSAWVKVKGTHTEEFIVGGYTEGQNSRASTFGALLIGQYEDGKLTFCGSVGGGFSDAQLESLKPRLEAIRIKNSPFANPVDLKAGKPIYIRPELWVEVRYLHWTEDHRLRMPTFMRLREDLSEPSPPAGEGRVRGLLRKNWNQGK